MLFSLSRDGTQEAFPCDLSECVFVRLTLAGTFLLFSNRGQQGAAAHPSQKRFKFYWVCVFALFSRYCTKVQKLEDWVKKSVSECVCPLMEQCFHFSDLLAGFQHWPAIRWWLTEKKCKCAHVRKAIHLFFFFLQCFLLKTMFLVTAHYTVDHNPCLPKTANSDYFMSSLLCGKCWVLGPFSDLSETLGSSRNFSSWG